MIPNVGPGLFIVLDGGDGCGKSVQLARVKEWLNSEGQLVSTYKEPDRNRIYGREIYAELAKPEGLHRTNPFGFQKLYAANSKESSKHGVVVSLANGAIVLCDRFRSSMVYGAKDLNEIPELMRINEAIIGEDFIWPDVLLIFDLCPEIAIERLKKRGRNLDGHENLEVLKRVRINYLWFAKKYPNCYVIPARGTEEEVFELVKSKLLEVLGDKLFQHSRQSLGLS